MPDEKTKLVKGMVCVNIHLSPYDYSGKNIQIYSDCFYLNKKDIDIDSVIIQSKYNYKEKVYNGIFEDLAIDLSNFNPSTYLTKS